MTACGYYETDDSYTTYLLFTEISNSWKLYFIIGIDISLDI